MFDVLSSNPDLTKNDGVVSSGSMRMRPSDESSNRLASERIYTLVEQCQDDRAAVESFISQRYAATYGATLTNFMPRLFSLQSAQDEIVGAFGLRPASQELFLERYLDRPIETAIGDACGISVVRQQIVEVGHFSGTGAGTARAMIMRLTVRLFHEGFKWVVFTGTVGLRNAFYRLGLDPIDMGPADPTRLDPRERLQWGSYYQGKPRVQFGNIVDGFTALRHTPLVATRSVRKAQP
jgi:hypothetical protein